MTTSASKVISTAREQIGYHEGRSGGHWNNNQKFSDQVPGLEWSDYQAWCATFVSWCAMKAGAADLFPRTASCATGVNWFKQRKRFSEYPAVGAQVFFGSGGGSHTGIVERYDSTYIWTIEGNTNTSGSAEGDGVYAKKHARRDNYVYGYGYPDYPEGVTSADPDWKGHKGSAGTHTDGGHSSTPVSSHPARYQVTIDGKKYGYGAKGAQVTKVGKALVAAGFGKHYQEGPGPNWTDADTENYADYQKSLGYSGADADGVPGETSLHKLLGKPKAKSAPVVDLSKLISAAKKNPPAKGQPVTYAGTKAVEAALVKEGLLDKRYADGHFGTTTVHAYSQWQKRYSRANRLRWRGGDVNGIPGMTSLKALGAKHGFSVTK